MQVSGGWAAPAEVKGEVLLSLFKTVSPVVLLVALPPFWEYESLGLGWLIFRVDIAYVLYVYGAAVAIVLLTVATNWIWKLKKI